MKFSDLIVHVGAAWVEGARHAVPASSAVFHRFAPDRYPDHSALLQIGFVYQETPIAAAGSDFAAATRSDLTLSLTALGSALKARLIYRPSLFDDAAARRMLSHLANVLDSALYSPQDPLSALHLLSNSEREQILVTWNAASMPAPVTNGIHELIEEHAAKTPGAIAVTFREKRLTYVELNGDANRLAHHLRRLNIGPETLVAIYMDRGPDMVVGILAVLKAGGAYVPLDASYPAGRLAAVIEQARPSVVLTHASLVPSIRTGNACVVCVDSDASSIAANSYENPAARVNAGNVALVIFTSGSTGQPKGVAITHLNLLHYHALWEHSIGFRRSISAVLQTASFSFAVFQGDVIRALGSGKTLVLCPREVLISPSAVCRLMRKERVDFGEFVPTLLRVVIRHMDETRDSLGRMQVVVVGSDRWYLREHLEAKRILGPTTRLIHVYGASETTFDSTWFEDSDLKLSENALTPIGRPFVNVRSYIVDSALQPVPVGVVGELCIGGAGVAREYVNLPALSGERFVLDPFSREPNARLFRTGDRARFLGDGTIELLGRRDQQVKIRGFRVELGEIEAALARHPDIRAGIVEAIPAESGDRRLTAYCVPTRPPGPAAETIRRALCETLPDFMVPTYVVMLDAFPLTPSGKVDRLALPRPWATPVTSHDQAGRTPADIEQILFKICQHALGRSLSTRNDELIAAGADSLALMTIVAGIESTFEVSIEDADMTRDLFTSIATLTCYVSARMKKDEPL